MQRPSSERARSIGSAAAWVLAPLLAALVGVAVVPEAFHARLPDAPPLHQRWMATPTTVERLRGIEAAAARLSDVVEIQGQQLEADPVAYRSFIEAEAAQARLANPNVVVLAGLSTRFASDPKTLLNAWDSVTDIVDGHYMAVPEGIRPDIA